MSTVYLALGSNMGDSAVLIERAIELLAGEVTSIERAPIYQSKPVGYLSQPDFLNTAIRGRTKLSPEALLEFIKTVEEQTGRVQRFKLGPREIDVDIIFYDDLVRDTSELTIPHSEFRGRDFVLRPLNDLNPRLTDPVSGRSVRQLLDSLGAEVRSIVKRVD